MEGNTVAPLRVTLRVAHPINWHVSARFFPESVHTTVI